MSDDTTSKALDKRQARRDRCCMVDESDARDVVTKTPKVPDGPVDSSLGFIWYPDKSMTTDERQRHLAATIKALAVGTFLHTSEGGRLYDDTAAVKPSRRRSDGRGDE